MPTRLLRAGILTSARINKLSAAGEVFYRRLMSKVCDHGLFDARPSILRTALYPLRIEHVSESDCEQWLTDCINAELLLVYQIDGKPYLKMLDTQWKVRSAPKFPPPINNCLQLFATVSLDVVVDVVRSRSRLIEDVVVDVEAHKANPLDKFLPPPEPLKKFLKQPRPEPEKPHHGLTPRAAAEEAVKRGNQESLDNP